MINVVFYMETRSGRSPQSTAVFFTRAARLACLPPLGGSLSLWTHPHSNLATCAVVSGIGLDLRTSTTEPTAEKPFIVELSAWKHAFTLQDLPELDYVSPESLGFESLEAMIDGLRALGWNASK